jgi:cytochrome c556
VKKWSITAGALVLTLASVTGISMAENSEETIKKVMKVAMKGGLCKSVASGKATKEQKKELLELFQNLAKAEPSKGDAESWKAKTEALVAAAQGAVDGKDGAGAQLKTASNCKACHDAHKGN